MYHIYLYMQNKNTDLIHQICRYIHAHVYTTLTTTVGIYYGSYKSFFSTLRREKVLRNTIPHFLGEKTLCRGLSYKTFSLFIIFIVKKHLYQQRIRFFHPLDGITNAKYKLLNFMTTNYFAKRRRH
jgi:hypothetical protein